MSDRSFRTKFSSVLLTGLIALVGLVPLAARADCEVEGWNSSCSGCEGTEENTPCGPADAERMGVCARSGADLICREPAAEGEVSDDEPRTPPSSRTLTNPLGENVGLPEIFGRIISILTAISGSLALLMFVYGGTLWLIANGDSNRIEAGKKAITWAVIGLVVIFGSYALLRAIFVALGGGGIL